MTSRQWAWQQRKQALGLCVKCGKPRAADSNWYCRRHLVDHRRREAERRRVSAHGQERTA